MSRHRTTRSTSEVRQSEMRRREEQRREREERRPCEHPEHTGEEQGTSREMRFGRRRFVCSTCWTRMGGE